MVDAVLSISNEISKPELFQPNNLYDHENKFKYIPNS